MREGVGHCLTLESLVVRDSSRIDDSQFKARNADRIVRASFGFLVPVDGELVQTNHTPSGPIDVSSGPARIGNFTGAEGNSDDWTFDGMIDDLHVYDRALSNEEIDLLLLAREQ